MKLIVELDVSESAMAIRNGTLAALVDSLSVPRMNIGTNVTNITGLKTAAPVTGTQAAADADQLAQAAADNKQRIDFEAALAKKQAAEAAAKKVQAAKEAKEIKELKDALAAKEAALAAEATTPETPTAPTGTAKEYTLESVRAVLARINKAGKTAQVKALLGDFGATKLTEISPSYYQALMEKAETL